MKLIADTHTHTIYSGDAYSTLLENVTAAHNKQLSYLASTDHTCLKPGGPRSWTAHTNQRMLPRYIDGVCLLHGIEADVIGCKGRLSVPEDVLTQMDWVIASLHADVIRPQSKENHTQMWMDIAEHPYVNVIGHIGDPIFDFEHQPVIQAFAAANKIVEINTGSLLARPNAYPICREIVDLCAEFGVRVIVNSDAHFCTRIGDFSAGIALLEEISYPKELILNASEETFKNYLRDKGIDL